MQFSILGPVEAVDAGGSLPLGGPRQRALLAFLLVNANRVVAADRLVEELWATPPGDAHAALQNQVSRLRKVVGDRLVTKAPGYLLHVEDGELDLDRFRALVAAAGSSAEPSERSRLLREADALFRGAPFAEIDAPFAGAEAAALEELRLAAIEARVDADLERGRHAELVPELGSLVARQPLRERLRGQHILALYRCGRQAEALEAYRATRAMLDEELGLEPSPALRELERQILCQDPTLARDRIDDEPAPVPAAAVVVPARRRRRPFVLAAAALALAAAGVGTAMVLRDTPTPSANAPAVKHPAKPRPAVLATPRKKPRQKRKQAAPVLHRAKPKRHAAAPPTQSVTVVEVVKERTATTRPQKRLVTPVAVPPPVTTTTTTTKPKTTPKAPANITPTVTTETVAAPPSDWRVMSDDFSGPPNWAMWQPWYDGSGASYAVQNGRLELTLDAGSQLGGQYNLVSVSFGSVCRWDGDFDARVDYQLLNWPNDAGARMQLNAWMPPNDSIDVARSSNQYGDTYDGDFNGAWNSYPAQDAKGTLRIARSGDTIASYYLDHNKWVLLYAGKDTNEVMIGLQLFGDSQDWAHKTVRAAFDNFSIAAPAVKCR